MYNGSMISAIKGKVFSISPGVVHIQTTAGLIYQVAIPVSHFSEVKSREEVLLHTVMRIKEDQVFLYGFLTPQERYFFEKFTSISGIGGKIALSLISAFSTAELVDAINTGNISKISSIPGIGKKTAQRVILELTGKLELEEECQGEPLRMKDDLVSGLVNLGYQEKQVKEAVLKIVKEYPDITGFEELFKLALKKISKL